MAILCRAVADLATVRCTVGVAVRVDRRRGCGPENRDGGTAAHWYVRGEVHHVVTVKVLIDEEAHAVRCRWSPGRERWKLQREIRGAVVDEYNTLIGIITSSTDGATEKERELRAITLAHIDRSIKKYTGFDLEFWLLGNLALKAELYKSGVAPALVSQLVQELKN